MTSCSGTFPSEIAAGSVANFGTPAKIAVEAAPHFRPLSLAAGWRVSPAGCASCLQIPVDSVAATLKTGIAHPAEFSAL